MTAMMRLIGLQILGYKGSDCKSDPATLHNLSTNPEEQRIVFIGLTNPEFIKLGQDKNYEKKGLKIFPESVKSRLNYADSLTRKK
jgi:hypothetical protein